MLSRLSRMSNNAWLKVALIVLFITILRSLAQPLIPAHSHSPFPESAIVEAGLLPIVFLIYGIVMLGLLAILFPLIQDRMQGSRLVKGLTFGLSFALLWFVYLMGPLPYAAWQLPSSLYYPVLDGITLTSLGLLLGMFVATDSKKDDKRI